jgi:hypothetical protein
VKPHPFFAASSSVFVITNVSADTPPAVIVPGLNDLSSCGVASMICGRSNAASFPPPDPWALYSCKPSVGDTPLTCNADDFSGATFTPFMVTALGLVHGFSPVPTGVTVPLTISENVRLGWVAPFGQFSAPNTAVTW